MKNKKTIRKNFFAITTIKKNHVIMWEKNKKNKTKKKKEKKNQMSERYNVELYLNKSTKIFF